MPELQFKSGMKYVTAGGKIITYVEHRSNGREFKHLFEDEKGNLIAFKDKDVHKGVICEYKGAFAQHIHIKNWKDPDSPDYMKIKEFDKIKEVSKDAEIVASGTKQDAGKPMFTCLPMDAMMELGKVAELGARKYGLHNYRKGLKVSRLLDAAFRHLIAATNGENEDPVDHNNHLASVAWNALAALQALKDDPINDDRYRK